MKKADNHANGELGKLGTTPSFSPEQSEGRNAELIGRRALFLAVPIFY
jgi:hypothetical protein